MNNMYPNPNWWPQAAPQNTTPPTEIAGVPHHYFVAEVHRTPRIRFMSPFGMTGAPNPFFQEGLSQRGQEQDDRITFEPIAGPFDSFQEAEYFRGKILSQVEHIILPLPKYALR